MSNPALQLRLEALTETLRSTIATRFPSRAGTKTQQPSMRWRLRPA